MALATLTREAADARGGRNEALGGGQLLFAVRRRRRHPFTVCGCVHGVTIERLSISCDVQHMAEDVLLCTRVRKGVCRGRAWSSAAIRPHADLGKKIGQSWMTMEEWAYTSPCPKRTPTKHEKPRTLCEERSEPWPSLTTRRTQRTRRPSGVWPSLYACKWSEFGW